MTPAVDYTTTLIETTEEEHPEVVYLARALSIAARIEPELIRRARLVLCPNSDPGIEADLWFSALVRVRSASAISLFPEVVSQLRVQLSSDQDLLNQAWADVIRYVHRQEETPPALLVEEEVTWLTLSDDPIAPVQRDALLKRVLKTMLEDEERAPGLAQWVLNALPRLPAVVGQSEAGWMLAAAASAILKEPYDTLDPNVTELSGIALPQAVPRVLIGVRRIENGVELVSSPLPTSHTITVPYTDPILLQIGWEASSSSPQRRVVTVPVDGVRIVETERVPVTIRTVTGATYTLIPVENPVAWDLAEAKSWFLIAEPVAHYNPRRTTPVEFKYAAQLPLKFLFSSDVSVRIPIHSDFYSLPRSVRGY